jgi:hypothetical protein
MVEFGREYSHHQMMKQHLPSKPPTSRQQFEERRFLPKKPNQKPAWK